MNRQVTRLQLALLAPMSLGLLLIAGCSGKEEPQPQPAAPTPVEAAAPEPVTSTPKLVSEADEAETDEAESSPQPSPPKPAAPVAPARHPGIERLVTRFADNYSYEAVERLGNEGAKAARRVSGRSFDDWKTRNQPYTKRELRGVIAECELDRYASMSAQEAMFRLGVGLKGNTPAC